MDQLAALLPRFGFSARVFFRGELRDSTPIQVPERDGCLYWVQAGSVRIEHADGGAIAVADRPTLVFYPRFHAHRLTPVPGASARLMCATIGFKEAHRNPFALGLPDVMQIALDTAPGLLPALEMLLAESDAARDGRQMVLERLCDIVMIQIIRHATDSGQIQAGVLAGLADPGIANVLTAVHAQPERAWRIEDMAAIALMSRSKFAEHFRQVVGMPPAQYLCNWRIAVAENLLLARQPIKLVAQSVGYKSQSAFTQAFAGQVGMTPKAWLRQRSNGKRHSR